MYAIQSKNRIIINVDMNAKNQLIGVLVKEFILGILVHVMVVVIKCVKLVTI